MIWSIFHKLQNVKFDGSGFSGSACIRTEALHFALRKGNFKDVLKIL